MKNNKSDRRCLYLVSAVVCILLFAVCLFLLLNPATEEKLSVVGFDTSKDFVKFMDVGQGDSALIYSNGYSAVIDMGTPNSFADICDDFSNCDIKEIDAVLVSHLHSDHIGALSKIAEYYKVKNLIMPEILYKSLITATDSRKIISGYGSGCYDAVQGMNFRLGEFEITVLGVFDDRKNENNRSIIAVAEIDGIKFLFTGDAEEKEEKYLLGEQLNLDCDVLKVPHHGSSTSSSKEFLNAVTPEYAVISVGENNVYGHPHKETLQALTDANAKVYRTDLNGDITFNLNDGKITVETEK